MNAAAPRSSYKSYTWKVCLGDMNAAAPPSAPGSYKSYTWKVCLGDMNAAGPPSAPGSYKSNAPLVHVRRQYKVNIIINRTISITHTVILASSIRSTLFCTNAMTMSPTSSST